MMALLIRSFRFCRLATEDWLNETGRRYQNVFVDLITKFSWEGEEGGGH